MKVGKIEIVDKSFIYSKKAFPKTSYSGLFLNLIYKIFFNIYYFFYSLSTSSKKSSDILKNKLTINRLKVLKECSNRYSLSAFEDFTSLKNPTLTENQLVDFLKLVKKIKELIDLEISDPKELSKHSNKIKNALDEALENEVYKKNKESKHPAINFLQELSFTIYTKSLGIEDIREYAKQFFKTSKEEYTFKDLGNLLDETVTKETGILHKNKVTGKILWAARYPIRLLNNVLSATNPLETKPYDANNNEIVVCDYSLDGKKARFYYGPNPAVGRIFQAYLDHLKKNGGIVHLHHNLQHLTKMGEDFRIYKLLRIEDKYKKLFRMFSTPMDGKAWECKDKRFVSFSNPKEFLLVYAKYAIANDLDQPAERIEEIEGNAFRYYEVDKKNDNGFYVGCDVMSDQQFKQAFIASQKAMQELYAEGNNDHWQKLSDSMTGRKRLSRMMQVATQGFIATGAILKLLYDAKDNNKRDEIIDSVISQTCKQDIDRGVVLNIITRLFFHLLTHKKITKEDAQIIVGSVLSRAKIVENRIILFERFEPLSDLLHFIGENDQTIKKALMEYSKHLRGDRVYKNGFLQKVFFSPLRTFSSKEHFSIYDCGLLHN